MWEISRKAVFDPRCRCADVPMCVINGLATTRGCPSRTVKCVLQLHVMILCPPLSSSVVRIERWLSVFHPTPPERPPSYHPPASHTTLWHSNQRCSLRIIKLIPHTRNTTFPIPLQIHQKPPFPSTIPGNLPHCLRSTSACSAGREDPGGKTRSGFDGEIRASAAMRKPTLRASAWHPVGPCAST